VLSGMGMESSLPSVSYTLGKRFRSPIQLDDYIYVAHPNDGLYLC